MTAISFGATVALTLMIGESLWRNCIPDIPMMSFTQRSQPLSELLRGHKLSYKERRYSFQGYA